MQDCIFCKIVRQEAPSWKIMETPRAYAFLDINPLNAFHTLVIPKKHYVDIFDTPIEELRAMTDLVKVVADLYKSKLGIQDVHILNNSGVAAHQEVFHIHFHIIPRYKGDEHSLRWKTYPELRDKFDQMLKELQ